MEGKRIMHSSIFIANKFLELAEEKNIYVSPMKLIKLVYIAHGCMLGIHGTPLIKETVEAWRYGPVIPELYEATKKYLKREVIFPLEGASDDEELTSDLEDIIQDTIDIYGRKSALDLSHITHMQGTPWMTVSGGSGCGETISNDLIKNYYSELLSREKSA